ncbi:MAG TPA: PQQ-dependent sugar dehydrogenase [Cyclobacteriaceae bacterium]|nr:PQQ-dependent sugar dehydrogenase [Cyclobacteriaceae bacterium]
MGSVNGQRYIVCNAATCDKTIFSLKHSFFALIFCLTLSTGLIAGTLPPGFAETLLAQGLDPTDILITPDGRIFITIKSGKVVILENDVLLTTPLIDIESAVDNFNERGLGHIVLDPGFGTNGFFYLYYTVKEGNHNRVSRFTATGNTADPASETIILDIDPMVGSVHNGGDMAFGPDGKLYIATGEGSNSNAANSLLTNLGKILRINADGTIPTDNPFEGSALGKNKAIYALGLRNPYSMDMDPHNGALMVSDVGGALWEEVNRVEAGRNYGWPSIEGRRTDQAIPGPGPYVDPLYAYPHGNGIDAGCAIVGAALYMPQTNQFPEEYYGKFFFADYCNGYIKYIDPVDPSAVSVFATGVDRPLAILFTSDGTMYYVARGGLGGGSDSDNTASNDGTLWRVTYTGFGVPTVAVSPQSTIASVGETATFTVVANGAAPITYQWQINDVDVSGATSATFDVADVQISDDGKTVRCVITNSYGTVTSAAATLSVTSNKRPEPQFTWSLPDGATLYQGGQVLSFSGSAIDAEDGELGAADLTWKVNFHHDAHFHPAFPSTSGVTSASCVVPKKGETSSNVWFRIYLTATDHGSPALSKTVYQDVFPQKAVVTVNTVPSDLEFLLDGQTIKAPYSFTSVVGVTRMLEGLLSQAHDDSLYIFKDWSEPSSERAIIFDTPPADKTFTATFTSADTGNGDGLTGLYFIEDKTFQGQPSLTRVDPQVGFNWGTASPDPSIPADRYTVRWIGEILPQFDDEFTFYFTSDDGVRVWIGSTLLIDQWVDQASVEHTAKIALERKKYPIKIEYYEAEGEAVAFLSWSTSTLVKQIVPTSQLFSADVVTGIGDEEDRSLLIYPTAVQRNFEVEYSGPPRDTWVLVDMLGRLVLRGDISTRFTVDAGGLAAGVYIFRIGEKSLRIMKK